MLMLVGCLMFSCCDNEPNTPEGGGDNPGTEERPGENPTPSVPAGNWYAKSYNAGTGETESLVISLSEDGTGTLALTTTSGEKAYTLTYTASGDVIDCQCTSDAENPQTPGAFNLILRSRDGMLYPDSEGFRQFVLSKDENPLYTDTDGKFIENYFKLLHRVWISEDGLNILDFTARQVQTIQLIEASTSKFDYYGKWEFDYKYPRNVLFLNNGTSSAFGGWYIKEVTNKKLVVTGLNTNTTQTFHVGTLSDIPDLTDLYYILTGPDEWVANPEPGDYYNLTFRKDGTFSYSYKDYYSTDLYKGDYTLDGKSFVLNATEGQNIYSQNVTTLDPREFTGKVGRVFGPLSVAFSIDDTYITGNYFSAKYDTTKWKGSR